MTLFAIAVRCKRTALILMLVINYLIYDEYVRGFCEFYRYIKNCFFMLINTNKFKLPENRLFSKSIILYIKCENACGQIVTDLEML